MTFSARHALAVALVCAAIAAAFAFLSSARVVTKLHTLEASTLSADIALAPARPVAGEPVRMMFTVSERGAPAPLMVHHGRRVHIVIVGEDLSTIAHIHPLDFSDDISEQIERGAYEVQYAFPAAGEYLIALDVMSESGSYLAQHYRVRVGGSPEMGAFDASDRASTVCVRGAEEEALDSYTGTFSVAGMRVECPNGYEITLTHGELRAGTDSFLRFHVEKDGVPLTDLSPFLEAEVHFAIVPESFDTLLHAHGVVDTTRADGAQNPASPPEDAGLAGIHIMSDGSVMRADGSILDDARVTDDGMIVLADGRMVTPAADLRSSAASDSATMAGMHHHAVPASFGPDLISEPLVFPHAGTYRIFAQMKHGSTIITSAFLIDVEEGSAEGEVKTIDLAIANGRLASGPARITVTEGDRVTLRVTSDADHQLHLHGYDKMLSLTAGETGVLTFTASASGRFLLELEDAGTEIGAVEVMPK